LVISRQQSIMTWLQPNSRIFEDEQGGLSRNQVQAHDMLSFPGSFHFFLYTQQPLALAEINSTNQQLRIEGNVFTQYVLIVPENSKEEKMRIKYILVGVVIGALCTTAAVALAGTAGTLEPAVDPANTFSYTLEDIYNRLDDGTEGAPSGWVEPVAGPAPTGHTLSETMALAPQRDDTNGVVAAEVAQGKTFWGLNANAGEWGLQTGTAPVAGVPKTGQTECYKSASPWGTCTCGDADCPSGQDGDLEMGVEWPNPRFTDNQDGTVTDNMTGLIWLQNANCDEAKTWADALTWANGLYDGCGSCGGTNNDCNLSDGSSAGDWRLPNRFELESLLHLGVPSPNVPDTVGTGQWSEGDPFTNIQSSFYWSSTTNADNMEKARRLRLYDGYLLADDKTNTNYVWAVRGGQ
jgi:hypothetical protein